MHEVPNASGLKIILADSAGFCAGVRRAVERAYELSEEVGSRPVMYGSIVHNDIVVGDLLERGFRLVNTPQEVCPGEKLIVRAHGITREEEETLRGCGAEIVDSTCVWVKRIQNIAAVSSEEGSRLVVCGDKDHPEVKSIVSYAYPFVEVISSAVEAESLEDDGRKTILVSQTTFDLAQFQEIVNILEKRLRNLKIFDTICRTTALRQAEAAKIAQVSDMVLVLGAAHSSNTSKLWQICQAYCSQTYLIQRPDQVSLLLKGRDLRQMRIGITAGASTPERMIREVIHVMTENQTFSQETENENQQAEKQEMPKEVNEQVNPTQAEESGKEEEEAVAKSSEASEAVAEAVVDGERGNVDDSDENVGAEVPASEDEDEEDEEEANKEFSFSDYIEGIPQLKRGVIVKGPIVRYDDEFVYVDVKDKSEGKVPRHEFVDDPEFDLDEAVKNHDEVEVYVRHIKNTDMGKEIILSKARVDFEKHKEVIRQAFEDGTPITVKVNNVVKDGVIAQYGSVDLYIHRTQLDLRRVDDLEPYRGKTLEVLITQFDTHRKRLRVSGSRRSLLQRERKEQSKEVWENIEVGKEYEGRVRSITNFGAFVDIGGVDGLVHISELSWRRVKHPSEVVSVGDILKVFVLDFDKERQRISLGYRRQENDPYYNIEERFPRGSIVRGIVVRMFPFGAFIEIAPGVDALCHISQISNYHLNKPEDVLQVGMEVDARVLAVSDEERKISISIKDVEAIDPANPEEFIQHQPRRPRREQADGEERRSRRRNSRDDKQSHNKFAEPTTYVDSSAGSSFAALANVTVSSKEGAEFMESLLDEQVENPAEQEITEEKADDVAASEADINAEAERVEDVEVQAEPVNINEASAEEHEVEDSED